MALVHCIFIHFEFWDIFRSIPPWKRLETFSRCFAPRFWTFAEKQNFFRNPKASSWITNRKCLENRVFGYFKFPFCCFMAIVFWARLTSYFGSEPINLVSLKQHLFNPKMATSKLWNLAMYLVGGNKKNSGLQQYTTCQEVRLDFNSYGFRKK